MEVAEPGTDARQADSAYAVACARRYTRQMIRRAIEGAMIARGINPRGPAIDAVYARVARAVRGDLIDGEPRLVPATDYPVADVIDDWLQWIFVREPALFRGTVTDDG